VAALVAVAVAPTDFRVESRLLLELTEDRVAEVHLVKQVVQVLWVKDIMERLADQEAVLAALEPLFLVVQLLAVLEV
jgi:hypothetical protein